MFRFAVLGPLRVRRGDTEIELPAQQRALLALLLVKAGQTIMVDEIVEVLWDARPPATAVNAVHKYIGMLRRALEPGIGAREQGRWLLRNGGGYRLRAGPDQLDLLRFRALVVAAGDARDRGDRAGALDEFLAALDLWRGPCASTVDRRVRAHPAFGAVDEEFLTTAREAVDIALAVGAAGRVLGVARMAATWRPLDEAAQSRLLLVLAAAGRQAEALAAYTTVRERLAEELGVDPGTELRVAHERVLRQELAPAEATPGPPGRGVDPGTHPRPAQLPPAVADFAGRAGELTALDALAAGRDGTPVGIAVIAGGAGVGKTALAVHWGHRAAHRFPDGQLYLNLRGHAPLPSVEPGAALSQILRSLGVLPAQIPDGIEEQSALYRSLLAGRRVLVVLDNAATVEQVRPLLPGHAGSHVVVTSRHALTGLVARDGARRLDLDVLKPDEAHALLASILGPARVDAEREPAERLAALCAHLPLALRIAAARLAGEPKRSIVDYLDELDGTDRLTALQVDEDAHTAVRAAFDLSYNRLTPSAQRLFRLLGVAPVEDFTIDSAAALAGVGRSEAEHELRRLAERHLLERRAAGRYTFHDLLRLYAAELAEDDDHAGIAVERLFSWYLQTANAAIDTIAPKTVRLPQPRRDSGVPPPGFAEHRQARSWLDAELDNVFTAITHAARRGPGPMAWRLADTLRTYFWSVRCGGRWLTVATAALDTARRHGDRRAEAATLFGLGDAHWSLGRFPQALAHFEASRRIARQIDDDEWELAALDNLGAICRELGRLHDALTYHTEVLDLNRRRGERHGQAVALGNLGLVCTALGRFDKADAHFRESLALFRASGGRLGEAATLNNLGQAYRELGRLDEAVDLLRQALDLAREIGSRYGEASALLDLAATRLAAGRPDVALDQAGQALRLARAAGERSTEADCLNVLGRVEAARAEHRAAVHRHHQALAIAEEIGYPSAEAGAHLGLAVALTPLDRPDDAIAHARHALATIRRTGLRYLEASALTALADAHLAAGQIPQASDHSAAAATIARETGQTLAEAARVHDRAGAR